MEHTALSPLPLPLVLHSCWVRCPQGHLPSIRMSPTVFPTHLFLLCLQDNPPVQDTKM